MSYRDHIDQLKHSNQKIEEQLNKLQSVLNSNDDLSRYEKMEEELHLLKEDYSQLQEQFSSLENTNREMKMELREMGIRERNQILHLSRREREIYFNKEQNSQELTLYRIERELDRRLKSQQDILSREMGGKNVELQKQLDEHSLLIQKELTAMREKLERQKVQALSALDETYGELEKEEISENTLKGRLKNNKLEMTIGLGWLNKGGILLILMSLGFLAYYAKNSYVRGFLIYLLGGLFLLLGEWFFRRGKEIFSQTMLGGGVGILYSGVFFSHFVLMVDGRPLLGMGASLGFAIGITLLTLLLSWRYVSQTILSLGLLGGFLPFLSYLIKPGFQGTAVYLAMGYLLLLNGSVIALSFLKNWRSTRWVSFILHSPALIYLVLNSRSSMVAMLYSVMSFLLYMGVILIPRYRLNKKIKIGDVILLALNTLINAVLIFLLLKNMGLSYLGGFTSLFFTAIYFLLAKSVRGKEKEAPMEFILFLGTALAFAIWMIPQQFGMKGITPGILIEGLVLLSLGYLKKYPYIEKAGWAAYWATLGTLVFWFLYYIGPLHYILDYADLDINNLWFLREFAILKQGENILLHRNFILFTLGSLLMAILYTPQLTGRTEVSVKNERMKRFRHGAIILSYLCLVGETQHYLTILENRSDWLFEYFEYINLGAASLISLLFSIIIVRIKVWRNHTLKYISMGTTFLSLYFWFALILQGSPFHYIWPELSIVKWIMVASMILFNYLLMAHFIGTIRSWLLMKRGSTGNYLFWMGICLLINSAIFISSQLPVYTPSIIYGFTFMVLATLFIITGFKVLSSSLRLLGLISLCISLLILLFPILREATQLMKILSFFIYGIILLLISFIYQNVNQRWGNDED